MLDGVTVFCFAASYATALVLEGSRLLFKSGVRGALLVGFAAAGLLAHSIYLAHRAASSTTTPLSSEFDWFLVAAWALTALYLYLTIQQSKTAVGLFILPVVLGLIGFAELFASRTPFPESRASQVWGAVHGAFILAGTLAVIVGFVTGLMYLLQAYRLKHKLRALAGFQLPNLEWLERINGRAITVSVATLSIGFLSGVVLNLVNHRLDFDELPWSDPIIWTSAVLVGWLVLASTFSALYRPAQQGRKVAYLTVASFLFLVLSLGVRLFLLSEHSPPRAATPASDQPAVAAAPFGPGGAA